MMLPSQVTSILAFGSYFFFFSKYEIGEAIKLTKKKNEITSALEMSTLSKLEGAGGGSVEDVNLQFVT